MSVPPQKTTGEEEAAEQEDAGSSPSASCEKMAPLWGAALAFLDVARLSAAARACSRLADVVRSDGLLWAAVFESQLGGGVVAPVAARAACRRCVAALRGAALRDTPPWAGE